jgi:hypothetical protein
VRTAPWQARRSFSKAVSSCSLCVGFSPEIDTWDGGYARAIEPKK